MFRPLFEKSHRIPRKSLDFSLPEELEILRNELHFEELQAEARRLDEMRSGDGGGWSKQPRSWKIGETWRFQLDFYGGFMGVSWWFNGDFLELTGVLWGFNGDYWDINDGNME